MGYHAQSRTSLDRDVVRHGAPANLLVSVARGVAEVRSSEVKSPSPLEGSNASHTAEGEITVEGEIDPVAVNPTDDDHRCGGPNRLLESRGSLTAN